MPRFRVLSERSRVWLDARSSVHPIHGEAQGLSGSIEVQFDGDGLDLSTTPAISLELAVEGLKSGNRLEDAEMMRRIDARRYPSIRGVVRDMKKAHDSNGMYLVSGDLTFHGVTKTVEGTVTVSQPNDNTIVIEGEQQFDIRDFKVDPPKILMLKVHPEVKVRIRVEAVSET